MIKKIFHWNPSLWFLIHVVNFCIKQSTFHKWTNAIPFLTVSLDVEKFPIFKICCFCNFSANLDLWISHCFGPYAGLSLICLWNKHVLLSFTYSKDVTLVCAFAVFSPGSLSARVRVVSAVERCGGAALGCAWWLSVSHSFCLFDAQWWSLVTWLSNTCLILILNCGATYINPHSCLSSVSLSISLFYFILHWQVKTHLYSPWIIYIIL